MNYLTGYNLFLLDGGKAARILVHVSNRKSPMKPADAVSAVAHNTSGMVAAGLSGLIF